MFEHPEYYGLQLRRMYDYETGKRNSQWTEDDERILKGVMGLIDHDQHYGVSNKDMLTWLKDVQEKLKNPGEPIIMLSPRYAPVEQEREDEKVIKLISSLLVNAMAVQSNTSLHKQYNDALAWLEKQKEQEHICDSVKFEEGYKTGYEVGLREQKDRYVRG